MNGQRPNDIPDANIERLLKSAAGEPELDFQRRVTASVLDELRKHPIPVRSRRPQGLRWAAVLLAVAATIAAAVVLSLRSGPAPGRVSRPESPLAAAGARQAGLIHAVYGLVSIRNGGTPKPADETASVQVGQWIETCWGSEADVLLPDESRMAVRPRSRVQLADKANGAKLVVPNGSLRLDVARQSPGRSLTVETPGAEITVLGTRLDVEVLQKPDGRKQTRVKVMSGKVELESAGRKIALLPNMEGIADEGEPPQTRSLTGEVNEITRLISQTEALAAESGLRPGSPSIIEFNADRSATVWAVVAVANPAETDLTSCTFSPAVPVADVEAYTLDGAYLAVAPEQDAWRVDLSIAPVPPDGEGAVILKATGIRNVFLDRESGSHRFDSPTHETGELSLIQFRLPTSAHVQELSPAPIETRSNPSRLLLTVAVNGRFLNSPF
ncbi:MAG: FecR domain-containing protein [Planctomycetaceae bacterium]|nr:FecR domain-containing protein [Planctomycetaceae bacterium]